jgi:hypothetical protein
MGMMRWRVCTAYHVSSSLLVPVHLSLDALNLRSDVISSIKILALL